MGLEQIEHLVLLMMQNRSLENRSFDHYLGALNLPPESRTDVEGLGNGPLPVNRRKEADQTEEGMRALVGEESS